MQTVSVMAFTESDLQDTRSRRSDHATGFEMMSSMVPRLFLEALIGGAVLLALVPSAYAQDVVQREIQERTGQQISQEDVLERLAQSGQSRRQVKNQLTALGYNPEIADPYFDRLDGVGVGSPLPQDSDFLAALAQIGLFNEPTSEALVNEPASEALGDSAALGLVSDSSSALGVFGQAIFSRATTQFQPLAAGPVDPSYMLGPGDQIQLILTGDVELAYPNLEVTREGFIVIPDVGQVFVNGFMLSDLRESLYRSLAATYSGVRRVDPTTEFHVSLGSLRTNQIFLVGEVTVPGAYQVSAVATVFNGLYSAGGPGENGSMRSVRIRRGGSVLRDVDLYDYMIRGETSADVRLENGDVLFVPFSGPRVSIAGMVRRPAIYEVKEDEGLRDVIGFAGGALAEGYVQGIRVERILPHGERTPELERVLIDVDLTTVALGQDFELIDGDRVIIPGISDQHSNQVEIEGHVRKPGVFELSPGMRLSALLDRSGGLLPDAFEAVAHIIHLVPDDSTYVLERVSLSGVGQPDVDVQLQELDRVVIYGRSALRTHALVSIRGEVKNPGVFPLYEGMNAQDLLLAADGFTRRADPYTAELVRRTGASLLTDTIAVTRDISFGRTVPSSLDLMGNGANPVRGGNAAPAGTVQLRDGDRIFVRRLEGLREEGDVDVSGEVLYPGAYAFELRGERVSELIDRAGGLAPAAYLAGARIMRDGVPMALDLEASLERPGGDEDFLLFPGDELVIPSYDGTVSVVGAVEFVARVQWRPDMGFGDYLNAAGGLIEQADRGRASIRYANGEGGRSHRFLFFRSDPEVKPGSTITVPTKQTNEGGGFDVDQWLTRILSLATVMVAFTRL